MKYKVTVPFHWYAGEAHFRPPRLSCTFDKPEDARRLKRRLNKINNAPVDPLGGVKDSCSRFTEMVLDKYFGI